MSEAGEGRIQRISEDSGAGHIGSATATATVELAPHPSASGGGLSLQVQAARDGRRLSLEYRLAGAIGAVRLPQPATRARTDGLWRTTCFEVFAARRGGYAEFNLSPSGAWAAYDFEGYRQGMTPLEQSAPMIVLRHAPEMIVLTADVALPPGADGRIGLSAVIEMADGTILYWALAHPSDKPDFHHPDSFVLDLS